MQSVELAVPAIDQVLAAPFCLHLDHKALPKIDRKLEVIKLGIKQSHIHHTIIEVFNLTCKF